MNLRHLLEHQLFQIGNFSLTVFKLLGVVLIWLAGLLILRTVNRFIRQNKRLLEYSDPGRRHSLYLIAQYIVWLLGLLAAFEILGLRISVLLAGSAAFLVGIGLGLQQIFRDIASGIFLLFEGTIELDDVLVLDGNVVRVTEINLRTSKLLTRDGQILIVPNHKFITENVANWTHKDDTPSRFNIQIPVHYENNVNLVQMLISNAAQNHSDVIQNDPHYPVLARMQEIGKGTMSFELLFWTHKKFEAESIKSDLRYAIRQAFEEHQVRHADPV